MSIKVLNTSLSPFFNLNIHSQRDKVIINMAMLCPILNTTDLPQTHPLLKTFLPRVLKSRCFNPSHFSFNREVKQTEMGHLFEHILLENLCQIKLSQGSDEAFFKGETSWDWVNNQRGTFTITIQVNLEDQIYLEEALERTIWLTELILNSQLTPTQQTPLAKPAVLET